MRIWKREWLFWLVALAALSTVSALAWLTINPSSPWVDRAMDLPAVGGLARGFAERYRGAEATGRAEAGDSQGESAGVLEANRGESETSRLISNPVGARPRVWLTRPTALRSSADAASPVVARIDPVTHLAQKDRDGDWYGLEWGEGTAWAYLPDYSEVADPPLGSLPDAVLPVPDLPPQGDRLAAAKQLFSGRERSLSVGRYVLYTDAEDPAMVSGFRQVVPDLERIYFERFGVQPIGVPRAALVVYTDQERYEQFKRLEGSLEGRRSSGHVGRGIVALYREGRTAHEVRSTLLHEIVHLLNRRAIGPALPPWLDEGIAEDLSGSMVDTAGRLQPGTIASTREVAGNSWRMTGADATLLQLRRRLAAGASMSLAQLCALDEESFQEAGQQVWNYARAGFFVRFLMARHPEPLRTFIASIARGEHPDAERLRRSLGRSWELLNSELAAWLAQQTPGQAVSAP